MNALSCINRSVLITGAGSGLGRSMAVALARAGARLTAAVFEADTGSELVDEIVGEGGRANWVQCDVRVREQIEMAIEAAVSSGGGLDVVIHNATTPASSKQATLEKLDEGDWEELVSTNLRAAFQIARAAHRHLKARHGTLILLSSAAGIEGVATLPEYAATKAAVRALAKSLAQEWGPDGITVNCLSPAGMSPAYQNILAQNSAQAQQIVASIPLGRIGDPLVDIAPVVVFLASAAARFMTGQTLVVSGGRTMLT